MRTIVYYFFSPYPTVHKRNAFRLKIRVIERNTKIMDHSSVQVILIYGRNKMHDHSQVFSLTAVWIYVLFSHFRFFLFFFLLFAKRKLTVICERTTNHIDANKNRFHLQSQCEIGKYCIWHTDLWLMIIFMINIACARTSCDNFFFRLFFFSSEFCLY